MGREQKEGEVPLIFCHLCPRALARLPLAWKETEKTATQAMDCVTYKESMKFVVEGHHNDRSTQPFLYLQNQRIVGKNEVSTGFLIYL